MYDQERPAHTICFILLVRLLRVEAWLQTLVKADVEQTVSYRKLEIE